MQTRYEQLGDECGHEYSVLKVNPPLCVTADDAAQLLQATDESPAEVLASA